MFCSSTCCGKKLLIEKCSSSLSFKAEFNRILYLEKVPKIIKALKDL